MQFVFNHEAFDANDELDNILMENGLVINRQDQGIDLSLRVCATGLEKMKT